MTLKLPTVEDREISSTEDAAPHCAGTALREQTALAALASRAPDAIVCADGDGCITLWNEAAHRLFGYTPSEAIGLSLDIIVPEPMRGAHSAGMRRILGGGTPRLVGSVIEVVAQHRDGHPLPIEMSLSMWNEAGGIAFGAIVRDVSQRRRNEDRLHQLAHFDQLTMLPNRTLLLERLDAIVAEGHAPGPALLLYDLDQFNEINDIHGHAAGDAVLRDVGLRLRHRLYAAGVALSGAAAATVARVASDEFAVLLPECRDEAAAVAVVDALRAAFQEPFLVDGRSIPVAAWTGLALGARPGVASAELLADAELALAMAKRDGDRRGTVFRPALRTGLAARRGLEAELRRAVAVGEFEVHYQPQVSLVDRAVTGAEALLRWRHPLRGLLAPGAFLDVLERSDLAVAVGTMVLDQACLQAARWRRIRPDLRIGVNLFEAQLYSDDLAPAVAAALARSGLPGAAIELEITEKVALTEDAAWIARVEALRALGVGLAFDDYGTGYASLSLLKRYPLTRLKIDRSFVGDIGTDRQNAAIVEAILTLGAHFGLDVIAEGVETLDQEHQLIAYGCREAQGFFYGKPMAAAAFERCLIERYGAPEPAVLTA